jgi:hypothetical protein
VIAARSRCCHERIVIDGYRDEFCRKVAPLEFWAIARPGLANPLKSSYLTKFLKAIYGVSGRRRRGRRKNSARAKKAVLSANGDGVLAMISTEHLQALSKALDGCLDLQKFFPADPGLRTVVNDLQGWIDIHRSSGQSAVSAGRRYPPRRPDSRYVRPLSEEIAFLVDAAARHIAEPALY